MRRIESDIPKDALSSIQKGTLGYQYRGLPCQKNPFDLALYLRLLYEVQPATIIEVGSFQGGSALFFADTLDRYGIYSQIYSIDLHPPTKKLASNISFLSGNALELQNTLSVEFMHSLARPLLVIEDSAHTFETTLSTLKFFDQFLASGEYIVIEDGIVFDLLEPEYRAFENGPNKAILSFLQKTTSNYMIDTNYCDYYGHNFTYNTNGYLKKLPT
jgi:cephalosporin hydroxylase